MSDNAFLDFINRYGPATGEAGAVRFAAEVFGVKLDTWQEDVLRAYGRGERRISIRACHGPGKTFIAAIVIWHQLLCRFPQKTVVTAPSKGQLEDALVAEVWALFTHLPDTLQALFELKQNRIELKQAPDESFFSARTARAENPEALQGVHSSGWVLLVADEASGVPEPIFEAAAGSMSGERATTLLLSNPVRRSGFFYDTHNKLRDMWFTVHVGYKDSSRVTEDFAYDIERRYGLSSNAYRVRVLGEFPLADEDTVIPWEMIDGAQRRDIIVPANLPEVWGFDIAYGGSDASSLVRRNRLACLPNLLLWNDGRNTMRSAGLIKQAWDEAPPSARPEWILGDVIGWGAGVVDRLREQGLPVRGINVAETKTVDEKYRNLRAQLWFRGREWLATNDHRLPQLCKPGKPVCSSCVKGGKESECLAERLAAELSWPSYTPTSSGALLVESKVDMKTRGFHSPNLADGFLLTFAVDIAGLVHGSAGNPHSGSNWSTPLSRGRSVV